MEVPLWAALVILTSCVVLLLCVVTFCVVRCFRPENSRGPEWLLNRDGKQQTVNEFFRNSDNDNNKRWLRQNDRQAAPTLTIPPVTIAS